jgi:hypothetical protein
VAVAIVTGCLFSGLSPLAAASALEAPQDPSSSAADAALIAGDLKVEHRADPLGVDAQQPRFSWELQSAARDKAQSGYQIQVALSKEALAADAPDVWDSGMRPGDAQSLVHYEGPGLSSASPYYWRVKVLDEAGTASAWSAIGTWTTGLLKADDWKASWISPASTAAGGSYLRKTFTLPAKPLRATAFVSGRGMFERPLDYQGYCCLQTATLARGIYELSANGSKVGDAELEAQPTDTRIRSLYRSWDVTGLLQAGENGLGFLIGEDSDVILQINIEWESGPATVVTTDGTWTSRPGPVTRAHKFHGETFDARKQLPGWDTAAGGGSGWSAVRSNTVRGTLEAAPNSPMRVVNQLQPVKTHQPAPGVYVVDFGKNISGSVALSLKVPAGRTVTIKHGERLYNGRVNNGVIQANQTSTFIGDGKTSQFAARFGYAGFRWAEITGLDAAPPAGSVTAREIRNDVTPTGTFKAATPLLNSLHDANLQTQVNGLHGIPEDTPTREKRGWMADAHLAAEATINNYDMAAFYTKFIQDMEDAQKPSGFVSDIVPIEQGEFWNTQSDPVWSAATVLIPYYVWKSYGDTDILAGHYDSMDRWMTYTQKSTDGYLITRPSHTWGQDWVADEDTDSKLFQSGFYYLTAKLMAEMAGTLGKPADASRYTVLAGKIAEAFNSRYFDAGRASYGGSQFSNALPLTLGIVPAGREDEVANTLVHQVMVLGGGHVRGGLPGAKYIVDALEMMGRSDVVNTVVARTDSPGWAYMLTHGPGSIWEEWYGSPSLNHPMFTFIDTWLYSSVAGISQSPAGGYREIVFDPQITKQLPSASGSIQTPYGEASSKWIRDGKRTTYSVSVPVGASGKLVLRNTAPEAVAESGQRAVVGNGIRSIEASDADTIVTLGSGTYNFMADPALAELVTAAGTTSGIASEIAAMDATTPGSSGLRKPAAETDGQVNGALEAYLQPTGDPAVQLKDAISSARTFSAAVMQARAEGLPAATADSLSVRSAATIHQLSGAVAASGVTVTAEAVEGQVASGGSTDAVVKIVNTGDTALVQASGELSLPAGWSARPTSPFPAEIAPGGEGIASYSVSAPLGSSDGSHTLLAQVSFKRGDDVVSRSATLDVSVGAHLLASGAEMRPAVTEAGATGYAAVRLRNLLTSTDQAVRVSAAQLPQGWTAQQAVAAVIPAGADHTVFVPLDSSASAQSGTVELSVSDEAGSVLATARTVALVRGSGNCELDVTGESCLPGSSTMLGNFENGNMAEWSTGSDSTMAAGVIPGAEGAEARLGLGALNVSAVRPSAAPGWREASVTLVDPVGTGTASALLASLRMTGTPDGVHEARIRATDKSGHTSELIRRVAPGTWNQLVLPTVESGLEEIASISIALRSTVPGADSPGFSIDDVRVDYGRGGLNLAAGAKVEAVDSLESDGWKAAFLVDTQTFSTAESQGYRTPETGPHSVTVDLGASSNIGAISLHPVTALPGQAPELQEQNLPASVQVEVSTDGKRFQPANISPAGPTPAGPPFEFKLSPVDARFVKISKTIDAGGAPGVPMALSEIEVFGAGNTGPGRLSHQTVDQGQAVTFDALPGRPGTTVKWQRADGAGQVFHDIPGALGTKVMLPVPVKSDDGSQFRAVVASADGTVLNESEPATLTVRHVPLEITANPDDLYLSLDNAAGGEFRASSNGSGSRLHWQSSENSGLTWRNIRDAGKDSLSVSFPQGTALPAEQFRLVATNLLGERVVSRAARVDVAQAPSVTSAAVNVAAQPGQPVELRVEAEGMPAPKLTWFTQADPGSSWVEVSGGSEETLRVEADAVRNGARYRAVAENAFGTATGSEIVVSLLTPANLPVEALSPIGDEAPEASGAPLSATGVTLTPLLVASLLLLVGCLLIAAQRLNLRRHATRVRRNAND